MARKMGRTVLLTFITTYAGFFSVGLSGIEVLSQFGLIASTGLLFNFIVTIVFIPAALALAGRWRLDGKSRLYDAKVLGWSAAYWRFLTQHRWHAFLLLLLSAMIEPNAETGSHLSAFSYALAGVDALATPHGVACFMTAVAGSGNSRTMAMAASRSM